MDLKMGQRHCFCCYEILPVLTVPIGHQAVRPARVSEQSV